MHIQQLGMRVRDRAALPSLRYACSGGAWCPAATVSLASSPLNPAAGRRDIKESSEPIQQWLTR